MARKVQRKNVEPTETSSAWRRSLTGTLAGVLAGGLVAFGSSWVLQSREEARADRLLEAQQRGAARVLYSEFKTSAAGLAVLANDRFVRDIDESLIIDLSAEDRRLLAIGLTGDEFETVTDAMSNVSQVAGLLASLRAQGVRKLPPANACQVRIDMWSMTAGAQALARLARGHDQERPLPPRPECDEMPARTG